MGTLTQIIKAQTEHNFCALLRSDALCCAYLRSVALLNTFCRKSWWFSQSATERKLKSLRAQQTAN